jgi:hypothetical protein
MLGTELAPHSCHHCQKLLIDHSTGLRATECFDFSWQDTINAAKDDCLFCQWLVDSHAANHLQPSLDHRLFMCRRAEELYVPTIDFREITMIGFSPIEPRDFRKGLKNPFFVYASKGTLNSLPSHNTSQQ